MNVTNCESLNRTRLFAAGLRPVFADHGQQLSPCQRAQPNTHLRFANELKHLNGSNGIWPIVAS